MPVAIDTPPEGGSSPTRREVLNYIWIGSMALVAVQGLAVGIHFSRPRFREGEFGGLFKVGRVVDLPSPGDPPLNEPKGKFWLVRTETHLLALYKACTHLDCMFDWNSQEGNFICPCHGSRFARDGALLSGPAPRSLDHFAVRIVAPQGDVLAQTDSRNGLALPAVTAAPAADQDPLQASRETGGLPPDALVWVDTGRKLTRGAQYG